MYIRVQTHPTLGESVGHFEGTFNGSLLGNAEIFLFLNGRLGGGRHRVTYRTEDPPAGIELYPYERMSVYSEVFTRMDEPYNIAAGAKGTWVRFDVDVGWLFWLRVVPPRAGAKLKLSQESRDGPELKLAPETQATFKELKIQSKSTGRAPISIELTDAPQASTSEGRVFLWMVKNISGIVATEQQFSIDRRAIAGAIAWEALLNPCPGQGFQD